MAYLEQGAIVKIGEIASAPVSIPLNSSVEIDVSLLNYQHNTVNIQEKGRLAFGQLQTSYVGGSYTGYFCHSIKTSNSTGSVSTTPDNLRAGFERPLGSGSGLMSGDLSCGLISENDYSQPVKILTLSSGYEQDSVVDKTSLVEIL